MASYRTSRNEDTSAENGVCIPVLRGNEISDHTRRVECIPLSVYNYSTTTTNDDDDEDDDDDDDDDDEEE